MLERAVSKTFTEIATLVLVASVFTVPIYMIHAFVFRDVHAVAELAPEIREFPEGRQVRGVAAADLDLERTTLWIVSLVALALLLLVARAARRVHQLVEDGGVPNVRDAISHMMQRNGRGVLPLLPIAVAATGALVVAFLVFRIGMTLTTMGSNEWTWVGIGLTRALAIAMFLAVLGGCIGALRGTQTAPVTKEPIDLY